MAAPIHTALQKIHHLDTSLPGYSHQLNEVLHGPEYEKCIEELEKDDQIWLIEYLDKV